MEYTLFPKLEEEILDIEIEDIWYCRKYTNVFQTSYDDKWSN